MWSSHGPGALRPAACRRDRPPCLHRCLRRHQLLPLRSVFAGVLENRTRFPPRSGGCPPFHRGRAGRRRPLSEARRCDTGVRVYQVSRTLARSGPRRSGGIPRLHRSRLSRQSEITLSHGAMFLARAARVTPSLLKRRVTSCMNPQAAARFWSSSMDAVRTVFSRPLRPTSIPDRTWGVHVQRTERRSIRHVAVPHSMFRGVTPSRHGITTNTWVPMVRPVPSIAESAHAMNRKTAFRLQLGAASRSRSAGLARLLLFQGEPRRPGGRPDDGADRSAAPGCRSA